MKKTILFALFFLCGCFTFAQDVLEVNDISQPNAVYTSPNDEAAVIIRCHESIPLGFSSSMDKSADPFRCELQGSDSVYYIAFPTGKRYRGRVLTIYSRGYKSVEIPLELQPKQLLVFQVTDPNALVDAGCYREHRNKGMDEFKKCNYEEARNQFLLARECSDCDKEENDNNIALADSVILFRREGEEAFRLLDYVAAGAYFARVLSLNANDAYANDRVTDCKRNFSKDCSTLFNKAEFYYNEREYGKAKELYEKVVEKECANMITAVQRLNVINSNLRAKSEHSRVLSYEFRKDVPIGLSIGKYNMHKVGGFFQIDLNTYVFDAIRSECMYGDEDFPELNLSFGWTVKIANPVWIHFGPGFTGKMYYGKYKNKKYPKVGYGQKEWDYLDLTKMGDESVLRAVENGNKLPEEYEDAWKHANYAYAISPVIGITAKYNYFALRLTYQYRWSTKKELKDFMGASRLSVGVGVAF